MLFVKLVIALIGVAVISALPAEIELKIPAEVELKIPTEIKLNNLRRYEFPADLGTPIVSLVLN